MQLDKPNFKQFKQFMHEEAFRNEQRYQSDFYQRNERLKEYKRERALKKKQQLEKDLEQMIVNLPRASQACRMEQLMTTKFLNEMPTQYRIISHFDGNDIAKRRLNRYIYISYFQSAFEEIMKKQINAQHQDPSVLRN